MYADWLEDHGDADRADFIRVQCRLAHLASYEPQREELEWRELDLLGRHGRQWASGLPAWARREPYRFHCGFVGEAFLTTTQLLKSGAALFRAAPIDRLVLRYPRGKVADLAGCPLLGRVTRLGLPFGELDPGQLEALLSSPHLGALRALDLSFNRLAGAGEVLARWPGLARLRRLELRRSQLSDADLAAVLASPHLGPLEHLDLDESVIGDDGARALARCPRLAGLRELVLSADRVGDEGAAALADSPHLSGLESLKLSGLGERMAGVVAGSPWLASLRRLELADVRLGERTAGLVGALPALRDLSLMRCSFRAGAMSALLKARWGKELRSLGVQWSNVTPGDVAALAASEQSSRLERLDLSGSQFVARLGPEHARLLLESPNLAGLRELGMRCYRSLGDAGRELAACPGLRRLRRLDLSDCAFSRESCLALLRSPHLAGLRVLALCENLQVGPAIEELAGSLNLPALTRLVLRRCGLTARSVHALLKSCDPGALRVLDLGFNDIGLEGALALMRSPHLRLASLDLDSTGLDVATRRKLAQHFGLGVVRC